MNTVTQEMISYNPVIGLRGIVMKLIDRLGDRYTRLLVVDRAKNRGGKDQNARWVCKCDCGNVVMAYGQDLARGKVKSCGCLNNERIAAIGHGNKTHGMTNTRVYRIWSGMLSRCNNPRSQQYAYYGARGIKVCRRWRKFENFLSDMGFPAADMSLDRIDGDGDYSPKNCRWATQKEQSVNRRNVRALTHNGVTLSVLGWSRALGIHASTMHGRIINGFPPEKLFAPALK
jgi:hypothetical protein